MIKRAWLIFSLIACLLPDVAFAQQTVRVVILPFKIHAQEELSYLQKQIPQAIKTQLEQEGAKVLVIDQESLESRNMQADNLKDIREMGIETGTDYVVWGSLTWIGQNFSLDAKLLSPSEDEKPQLFSAEGEGVENLPGTLTILVNELGLKLFKREKITEVRIKGNNRIEEDAIRRVLKIKPGDVLKPKDISEETKAVYKMGYFDDIRIEAQTVPQGKIITVVVTEKPTVRSILLDGNTWVYDDDEIKEEITLRKGSILNINIIQNDMRRIEELYKEKNFYNVKVSFKVYPKEKNQADIEYVIEEGDKFQIKKITFVGNTAFSSSKLKRMMSTSEKGLLSFITSSGDLNQEQLIQDAAKLTAFYHNNGYVQARVGEPEVIFEEDGIVINVRLVEGPQFKVGTIAMAGDLIIAEEQLLQTLEIAGEEYYNRDTLRLDVIELTDIYSDEGYAYADIAPRIEEDPEKLVVNITFEISKGKQVYFEEIVISGNSKTRDKVIRRQLKVYEQELYSGRRLKRSVRNLYRLDFFEDIKVNTIKGSADDKMRLRIDVTEKRTGAFSFGAGYGNIENLFLTASISEKNLFGRGQILSLKGQLGTKTQRYTLSFTEPWFLDIPLSAGGDIYNWAYSFATYDKDSVGAKLRLGYPLFDFTRGNLTYTYDIADIHNVEDDASDSIKHDAGENIKSSITARIRYDSRDQLFHPTGGSTHNLSYEFAGLGGTVGFNKIIGETGWYFPLVWQTIGVLHGKAGYVRQLEGKTLPDYEKFYMVGPDALRGFERDDLSPRDNNGNEIGGNKFIQFNAEVRFPLVPAAGVYGVTFFDTGDIYDEDEDIELDNLRESAGLGVRWLSPMGPVRLEYGWILDPKPTDAATGNWEFSMASAF
ncbi:Outer membrane protein assembly factor YaeT [Olavius sp. associated proteobacterium Delta 1]|nr:Outer membrane protein assembly factor YaeT [Olavius sp. associated proteobacterium Delta 1]